MKTRIINSSKFQLLAGSAAVLSILACHGTAAFVSLLSLLGRSLNIHQGAWTGAITYISLIARQYTDASAPKLAV